VNTTAAEGKKENSIALRRVRQRAKAGIIATVKDIFSAFLFRCVKDSISNNRALKARVHVKLAPFCPYAVKEEGCRSPSTL